MRRWSLVIVSAAIVLTACGDDGSTGTTSGVSDPEPHELTVSAASSLTDAFGAIGTAFERANPGVRVTFNFGPSDGLATQIEDGAPVDVFASASSTWMDAVQDEGLGVSGRKDFAKNELAIIAPRDNPAGIGEIDDLANAGVKLVIAAEGVPAGDYAREILANAEISDAALANVVSNAEDVRAVVTAVVAGDADAGIVYVTDVTSDVADQLTVIQIPDDVNVIATYPIAVIIGSEEADLAQRFVDHVLDEGQQTLAEYGFVPVA